MPDDPTPPEPLPSPEISPTVAVVADALAAHAAGHGPHGGPVHTHCENCGTELRGAYCHKCGQHDFEFHRSFGHVFLEALENFFHFDAKLFRNIVTLLFRPGHLSADFNAGKRASQMPPFRLYLFVSVLFFFLSFIGSDESPSFTAKTPAGSSVVTGTEWEKAMQDLANETSAAGPQPAENPAGATPEPKPAKKTLRTNHPGKLNFTLNENYDTPFYRYLTERGKYAFSHEKEMFATFLHALPKMLLVCLPFFALYTRILFRKAGLVYLQHLVIALHFHTFIYLWRIVADGWVFLAGFASPRISGLLATGANLWLVLYTILMFRHLFGLKWRGTLLRIVALAAAYGTTLGLGFLSTLIAVLFLL